MRKTGKWGKAYVKLFIKSSGFFYTSIVLGILILISLCAIVKLDVISTYDAEYKDGLVIIDEETDIITDNAFIYADRNENIISASITETNHENGKTYILLSDTNGIEEIEGDLKIDVVVARQSLLRQIFVKAGGR